MIEIIPTDIRPRQTAIILHPRIHPMEGQEMSTDPRPQLGHVAIFVHDLALMRDFYSRVFGLTVSDEGRHPTIPVDMVFMTANPQEHHQFVVIGGRPEEVDFSLAQQVSFIVESLDELRTMRDRVIGAGLEVGRCLTHGNAWSIYFADPEGNNIEVYAHTPWYVPQPHVHPLDLDQSNDEILRLTEEHCREDPAFMSAEEHESKMRRMMQSAG
jgi:catechol 2,3-dioxygenase